VSDIRAKLLLVIFALMVIVLSATAQSNQMLVQLIGYDANTQQSKIHIQNTAGFELNELDFYINNIKTGRVADRLADGKAVLYFQTITPGTYDVTIKTKEGIEFTKEIKFGITSSNTASQVAENLKYQELLRERAIEQAVKQQRQQQSAKTKTIEEKEELPEETAEKPKYNPTIIILILIFLIYIFLIIHIFKRKK
jgi:hypothetical protein